MKLNSSTDSVQMNVRLKLPIGSLEARIYTYLKSLSATPKELIFNALFPFYDYESLLKGGHLQEEIRFAILKAITQLQTRLFYLQEIYARHYSIEDLHRVSLAGSTDSNPGILENDNNNSNSHSPSISDVETESEILAIVAKKTPESLFDHSLVSF